MRTFHNSKQKVVEFLDEHWYPVEDKYVPGATHVLDMYPKGYGFNDWLKQVGMNASEVLRKAGIQGSNVHNAIERAIKGQQVTWMGEKEVNYTEEEWKMLMRFVEFWEQCKPEPLGVEVKLASKALQYGGTIDLPCKISGEVWLIDHKTSNMIHKTHELQLAAYAMLWNEVNEVKIERTGVLWLKAKTRGEAKDKIQGRGWQLKEFDRHYTEAFKIFKHIQAIFIEENPPDKWLPKNLVYPDKINLYNK